MNRLTLRDRWNRFWFEPAEPQTLGFCRLILMLGAFLYYHARNYESWGYVRASFWQSTWLFLHLHWHPLSPMAMGWLGFAWKASLLLAGIGLFTRFSCAIAFALGLYLIGLPNNIGKVDHNDAIVLWSFLIMAVARSGDAWSIDALIRTARGKRLQLSRIPATPVSERTREDPGLREYAQTPASAAPEADPEYRWPLRMMQVLMVVVFCISGCAKLRTSGVAWAFSDNLRNTFIMQQYLGDPPTNWSLWIASQRWLCYALAAATLVFETTAPLALFSRTARWIIIPSLFMMQIGNELVLGINFRQFMLCYVFWLPWTDIGRSLRRSMQASAPAPRKVAVLFDGSCGLCQRTMAIIRRLDLLQMVEILDAMNDWSNIAARYPSLDQDECLRVMHAIDADGRVTTRFYAYRTLCKMIPLGWLMLPLLYIPGVPTVGNIVYDRIASNRFRNGCAIGERPTLIPSPGNPGEG